MQRVEVLLQKLNEQILSNASASHILVTLQLLQREYLQKAETEITIDSSVSVVLPYANALSSIVSEQAIQEPIIPEYEGNPFVPETLSPFNEVVVEITVESNQVSEPHSFHVESYSEEETVSDTLKEINDKLKTHSDVIVDFFSDVPIKELKKAIGINDRYLYINELFNGDEAMFDRSIKTLDQFVLLQDAESWIRRELSVKIGWKEDNPVVHQFGLLLKRRFS